MSRFRNLEKALQGTWRVAPVSLYKQPDLTAAERDDELSKSDLLSPTATISNRGSRRKGGDSTKPDSKSQQNRGTPCFFSHLSDGQLSGLSHSSPPPVAHGFRSANYLISWLACGSRHNIPAERESSTNRATLCYGFSTGVRVLRWANSGPSKTHILLTFMVAGCDFD
jgi:hypothetical protein